MLTIHSTPAGVPILVGSVAHHRRGPIPGRPCQAITAWCAVCRDHHSFAIPDVFPVDAIELVAAPCSRGPWVGGKLAVALDPCQKAAHRRIMVDFAARLRRWRVEQRLRRQFAEARAIDRKHRAEGWDVVAT